MGYVNVCVLGKNNQWNQIVFALFNFFFTTINIFKNKMLEVLQFQIKSTNGSTLDERIGFIWFTLASMVWRGVRHIKRTERNNLQLDDASLMCVKVNTFYVDIPIHYFYKQLDFVWFIQLCAFFLNIQRSSSKITKWKKIIIRWTHKFGAI